MWTVEMYVDGEWWEYGTYADRNKANEIGIKIREERGCWIKVYEK